MTQENGNRRKRNDETHLSRIMDLDFQFETLDENYDLMQESCERELEKAQNLLVISDDTRSEAVDIAKGAKTIKDYLEKKRVAIKEPYFEKCKNIDNFFKSFPDIAKIIGILKTNILDYDAKIEAARIKEERRLAKIEADFDAKNKTTEEDVKKVNEQRNKVEEVQVENTQHSGRGAKTTYTSYKEYTVTNASKVPEMYKIVDMAKVKEALKSGRTQSIPGIKVEDKKRMNIG